MPSNVHHCWMHSNGCTLSQDACTKHYWFCTGSGTRQHRSCKVAKGKACESTVRDTATQILYTKCGRSTYQSLRPSACLIVRLQKRMMPNRSLSAGSHLNEVPRRNYPRNSHRNFTTQFLGTAYDLSRFWLLLTVTVFYHRIPLLLLLPCM